MLGIHKLREKCVMFKYMNTFLFLCKYKNVFRKSLTSDFFFPVYAHWEVKKFKEKF